MKQTIYLLLVILLISCKKEKSYSEIEIQANDLNFVEIQDDVVLMYKKFDTIYKNANGDFVYKQEYKEPKLVLIKLENKYFKTILLPKKKTEIIKNDSVYVFRGKNKSIWNYFNGLNRPLISSLKLDKSDTTAYQIQKSINKIKENELNNLRKVVKQENIDDQFKNILKKEIDYYYALKMQQIIMSRLNRKPSNSEELIHLSNKILKQYPLETEYKPFSWLEYAKLVLIEKNLKEKILNGEFNVESFQEYSNSDYTQLQYDLINEYSNKEIVEKVSAYYLLREAQTNEFEKALVSLSESFKTKFTKSKYITSIEPKIAEIKDYYKKISRKTPSNIKFLNGDKIDNFKQLTESLKGQKYFIDVWATWCGPCKREFKFNKKLNVLLESKGYEKLYISIDKPEQREKWKNDIQYYDLNGTHFIANKSFLNDFIHNYSTIDELMNIPQYLIIDSEGNLITNDAPRPSNLKELERIL